LIHSLKESWTKKLAIVEFIVQAVTSKGTVSG
jgi:hypothetical protein